MANLDDKVSVREAYLAMFEYLRSYYERGQSDEIGSMLGGLSLLSDGESGLIPRRCRTSYGPWTPSGAQRRREVRRGSSQVVVSQLAH